jgi:site-specific DNA-methyltransferase (adenine-specific)/modification methylase
MTPECVRIGTATLWFGDSREIAPTLPRPAAIIADPPYGQRLKTNVHRAGAASKHYPPILGDDQPFDPQPWLHLSDIILLWGAHRFADRLPPGSWLVWDKRPDGSRLHQGDGEAALILHEPFPRRQRGGRVRTRPIQRPMRIYRLLWSGWRVGPEGREDIGAGRPRVHPTQKPVAIMRWCIREARVPAGGLILDPWMGSGSTLVAAQQLGHECVGIEAERRYFDAACERLTRLQAQPQPGPWGGPHEEG